MDTYRIEILALWLPRLKIQERPESNIYVEREREREREREGCAMKVDFVINATIHSVEEMTF